MAKVQSGSGPISHWAPEFSVSDHPFTTGSGESLTYLPRPSHAHSSVATDRAGPTRMTQRCSRSLRTTCYGCSRNSGFSTRDASCSRVGPVCRSAVWAARGDSPQTSTSQRRTTTRSVTSVRPSTERAFPASSSRSSQRGETATIGPCRSNIPTSGGRTSTRPADASLWGTASSTSSRPATDAATDVPLRRWRPS